MRTLATLIAVALALLPAAPSMGQSEFRPAPEALARARADGDRMITVLIAAIACLPQDRQDAEARNAALATLVRQFVEDFDGMEFWRGWIRGYIDAGFSARTTPAPVIGSIECLALRMAAHRTLEEAWARDRLSGAADVAE